MPDLTGLFSAVAGGVAKGVGAGIAEQAKAERELRLKEVDRQYQERRDALQRQHAESMQQRGFENADAREAARRKWESEQPGTPVTEESGDSYVGTKGGGPLVPQLKKDGTPFRPLQTNRNTSEEADVREAKKKARNAAYDENKEAIKIGGKTLTPAEIEERVNEAADAARLAYRKGEERRRSTTPTTPRPTTTAPGTTPLTAEELPATVPTKSGVATYGAPGSTRANPIEVASEEEALQKYAPGTWVKMGGLVSQVPDPNKPQAPQR